MDLKRITAADHLWATDITYIPLGKRFLYLMAIMDHYSRNLLSWNLSNSLDIEFCLEALDVALLSSCRKSTIHYSEKGYLFTS